eukprot:m.284479 g.284479  ORF g.284479 m.284479 type:complete len:50 (+) comp54964_c1_seq62:793-942(+)
MPWLLHRPLTVASFSRFGLWRKDGPNHPVANQQPAQENWALCLSRCSDP